MSRAKVNPYKKKVAASVAKQYILEAHDLKMSLSTYIDWLKQGAGYRTQYDDLNDEYERQKSATQGNAEGKKGE